MTAHEPSPGAEAIRIAADWDQQDGDEHIPMEAGTYRIPASPWSVTDLTVAFPDGWTSQYGHTHGTNSDEPDELGFYAVVVDEIFSDSCSSPPPPRVCTSST